MTSYQFGGALYRNSTDMHDAIARAWIGSGGEPDLATVLEVQANMNASLDEIEAAWELTPEHDTKTQQELSHLSGDEYEERLEEEGGHQNWDRDDFVAAVDRLREELEAEAEEKPTYTLLANLQAQGDTELCDMAFDTLELDAGITRDDAIAQAKSFTESVIGSIDHDRYAGETVTVTTFLYTLEAGETEDDGGEEIDETEVEIPAGEDATEEEAQAALDALGRNYVIVGEDVAHNHDIRLGREYEDAILSLPLWFETYANIVAWAEDDDNHVDRDEED